MPWLVHPVQLTPFTARRRRDHRGNWPHLRGVFQELCAVQARCHCCQFLRSEILIFLRFALRKAWIEWAHHQCFDPFLQAVAINMAATTYSWQNLLLAHHCSSVPLPTQEASGNERSANSGWCWRLVMWLIGLPTDLTASLVCGRSRGWWRSGMLFWVMLSRIVKLPSLQVPSKLWQHLRCLSNRFTIVSKRLYLKPTELVK